MQQRVRGRIKFDCSRIFFHGKGIIEECYQTRFWWPQGSISKTLRGIFFQIYLDWVWGFRSFKFLGCAAQSATS